MRTDVCELDAPLHQNICEERMVLFHAVNFKVEKMLLITQSFFTKQAGNNSNKLAEEVRPD